jgi:hypothetical protein
VICGRGGERREEIKEVYRSLARPHYRGHPECINVAYITSEPAGIFPDVPRRISSFGAGVGHGHGWIRVCTYIHTVRQYSSSSSRSIARNFQMFRNSKMARFIDTEQQTRGLFRRLYSTYLLYRHQREVVTVIYQ